MSAGSMPIAKKQTPSSHFIPWRHIILSILFIVIVFGGATILHYVVSPLPPLHFSLTDQRGRYVTERDFADHPVLIYFGFTQCSSMCPLTLTRLSNVLAGLHTKINVLFITIDPAYDTPEVLNNYLQHFPAGIIGLTGSKERLDPVYAAFRVYPGATEDKTSSDHSGFIYLIGADGRVITYFNSQMETLAMSRLIHSFLTP